MKTWSIFILYAKALFSVFQVFVWMGTLFLWYEKIQKIISTVTHKELIEDTHDFFALKLIEISHTFSPQSENLLALYFILEWAIKLSVLYGIYKEKIYILPFAFFLFGSIFFYEIFLFFSQYSLFILGFIFLDSLLLWVIFHEYQKLKKKSS